MNHLALAAGAWCWHDDYYADRWSLLDLPDGAAAAGLVAMECNDLMLPAPRLSRVRQRMLGLLLGAPPELWRYSRANLHRLQNNAQTNSVHILAWAMNSDFTVACHHWPAQRLYLHRGMAAARLLTAPLLRVTLGGSAQTPRSRDALIVRRLAALVQATPVAVTLENHWGVSADIERHVQIFDTVAASLPTRLQRRFGCCFDPGNVPEGPQRPRWWRMLAHRANHFHLKTTSFNAAGDEVHLPYAAIFDLLAEVGYCGPVTVEYAGQAPPLAGIQQSVHLYHRLVRTPHG